MKKVLILFAIITVLPLTVAQSPQEDLCTYLTDRASTPQPVPSFLPYSNEALRIETTSGALVGHAVIEESQARFVDCTDPINETYLVQVKDVETIQSILDSNSPEHAYDAAKDAGDIVVEGQTVWRKAKFSALSFAMRVYGWF